MKSKLFFVLAILSFVFTFAACGDDNDGDWDPMEWSGYSKNKDIVINVPAEGGSTILHCKNYNGLLIYNVTEICDTNNTVYSENDSTFNMTHVVTKWADVQCSGSQLQVTMKRNDSGMYRDLYVGVTVGDISDHIKFVQAAN